MGFITRAGRADGATVLGVARCCSRRCAARSTSSSSSPRRCSPSATGIVGATVTVLGIMAGPMMIKTRATTRELSAGAITAGGTLGILIPPSVMLIVMGAGARRLGRRSLCGGVRPGLPARRACIIAYTDGPLLIQSEARSAGAEGGARHQFDADRAVGVRGRRACRLRCCTIATLGVDPRRHRHADRGGGVGALGAIILVIVYRRFTWKGLQDACSAPRWPPRAWCCCSR